MEIVVLFYCSGNNDQKRFVHVQYSNNVNFFWIFWSVVGWIHRYRTWGYRVLIMLHVHCLMYLMRHVHYLIQSLLKSPIDGTSAIIYFQIRNLRFVHGCIVLNPGVMTWTHGYRSDIWVFVVIHFADILPTPANWVFKGLSAKSPSPSISMPGGYK